MPRQELIEERLTHSAIGAFFEVYNTLGYGFLEHVYTLALERELLARGHQLAREFWVPVLYKGDELCRQRLDMIVDDRVVIEIKASPEVPKAATRQLFNYLRASRLGVGLLFHFGLEPSSIVSWGQVRLASRREGANTDNFRLDGNGRIAPGALNPPLQQQETIAFELREESSRCWKRSRRFRAIGCYPC